MTGQASHLDPIPPGATLGVLGGGQLGRMFAIAARQAGYRVACLDPVQDCPTGQVADVEIVADYADLDAARALARQCAAVTVEFENIPVDTLTAVAEICPTRPMGQVLHIAQHRLREKRWLREHGYATAPFAAVGPRPSAAADVLDLELAAARIGWPAILKTAAFGYDGKGQRRLTTAGDLAAARRDLAQMPHDAGQATHVLEGVVPFDLELSVVVARTPTASASFPVFENRHANGILDVTCCPANVSPAVQREAQHLAESIARDLDVVGVLCVELFLRNDGALLVNELAPRPHNSGHLTIDACLTSQFAQQLRCTCGLPLGDPKLSWPGACMVNLLGDVWFDSAGRRRELDVAAALADAGVRLHLYGKAEPRPGRKMGHLTAYGDTPQQAQHRALAARAALVGARP